MFPKLACDWLMLDAKRRLDTPRRFRLKTRHPETVWTGARHLWCCGGGIDAFSAPSRLWYFRTRANPHDHIKALDMLLGEVKPSLVCSPECELPPPRPAQEEEALPDSICG